MRCSICKQPGHNARTCSQKKECPICMEYLSTTKNYTITKCGHEFCTTCLLKSCVRNGKCPICRDPLATNYLVKSMVDHKYDIIRRTLEEFNLLERFPTISEDNALKLKIVNDFATFSDLLFHFCVDELNS